MPRFAIIELAIYLYVYITALFFNAVQATITPLSIRNLDTVNGRQSFYEFKFQYDQAIHDAIGGFKITFPPEIPISLFQNANQFECYFQVSYPKNKLVPCTYNNNREVQIKIGEITPGLQSITIGYITNPTSVKGTAQFKLCVQYNDYSQECEDNFGSMKKATLIQASSFLVSQGSSWLFNLTLNGVYKQSQYDVRISFPDQFTTQNAGCEIIGIQQVPQSNILYNQRQIECKNMQIIFKGEQQIRIINMVNPTSQVKLNWFQIQILQSTTSQILEEITFSSPYSIQTGVFQTQYFSDNLFKYSNTSYYFYLTPQSLLDKNSYIEIKFGSQWTLYSQNCTVIHGLQQTGSNPIFCSLDPYLNRYLIGNYNSTSYQNQILIKIPLQTPQNYVGSLQEARVHPLQQQIKLKSGQIGPLEFTFFLKTLLPRTNYRSVGKIVLSITPQIANNIPIPPNEGILKCLFFKTIISADCLIENIGQDYTQITIYTPEDYDFKESEIPITITTEGSKNGRPNGLLISSLVQRYLFNFLTYTQYLPDPMSSKPVEGYFQEWIPDPIQFQNINFDLTTTNSKEMTHLMQIFFYKFYLTQSFQQYRFTISQFPQDYLKWSSLTGRQYFWKITFVNDAPGPILQWTFDNQVYGELKVSQIPCLVYNSMTKIYTQYTNVICNLVRYPQANPFIYIQSVDTTLLNNPSASQNFSFLRFSLIENTPGMISDYVEVYYKQFSFTITPPYNLGFQNHMMGLFSKNANVSQSTDLTFFWTSSSAYLSYAIYQFDQSCFDVGTSITTKNNDQRIFAKNANYFLVQKNPNNFTGNAIADTFSLIKNCFYSNTFQFFVTSYLNNQVYDKYIFNYYVSPASILPSTFQFGLRPNANVAQNINDVIRVNEQHQFFVQFQTTTALKISSLININIQNNNYQFKSPEKGSAFFCNVQGLQNSLPGQSVNCSMIDSQNIQIKNFDSISDSTTITVDFRLLILSTATQPQIQVDTKYINSSSIQYFVDRSYVQNTTTGQIVTNNQYDTLNEFQIQKQQYRYELRPPQFVGPIYLQFDLINLPSPLALSSITVLFPAQFTFPRNINNCNQPLKCIINQVRFSCNCSINNSRILVNIQTNYINVFEYQNQLIQNDLIIDTEFVSPTEGFLHPPTPGFYEFDVNIINLDQKYISGTRYMRIKGQKAQLFNVQHVIRDAQQNNLFIFQFQLNSNTPVQSYQNGGRIQFELPTVDNKGNPMFDQQLGNNYNTGDYLGCVVQSSPSIPAIDSQTQCRFQKSETIPNSAIIELVSFPDLPVNTNLKISVAKIQNPQFYNDQANQIMDANIILNIFNSGNPLTGNIYYDYFNILLDIRQNQTLTIYDHNQASQKNINSKMPWGQTTQAVNTLNGYLYVDIIGQTKFQQNDYYVIEVPNFGKDQFQVSNVQCNQPNFYVCTAYLNINWVVVQFIASAQQNQLNPVQIQIKKLPESVSRTDITFNAYIWSGQIYQIKVIHYIYAIQYKQLMGQMKNGQISILGSAQKAVKLRTFVPVRVTLQILNKIPSYGAIQIIFNSQNVNLHAHCRSSLTFNTNSLLVSSETQSSIKSGSLGCQVQTGTYLKQPNDQYGDQTASFNSVGNYISWVITGFQEIPASILPNLNSISIEGFVDFLSDTTDKFQAYTYGSSLENPIIETGRFIDYYNIYPNQSVDNSLHLQSYNSLNSDKYDFLHVEVQPLRAGIKGQRSPFKMVFSLASNSKIQAYSGRLRLRFASANQLQDETTQVGTPLLDLNEQYSCSLYLINEIVKDQYIGCTVISQIETNKNSIVERAIEFTMVTNTDLVGSQRYLFEFTTAKPLQDSNNNQVFGILFPNYIFTYKIELSMCTACEQLVSGFSMWQQHYYQIYGASFVNEVISYNNRPNEWNIFTVDFKTPSPLDQSQYRLVIELPTTNLQLNTQLFQNDLGQTTLNNLDTFPCDLLLPKSQSINCVLIKGDYNSMQPAKILVSFTNSITSSKIAFQIINPQLPTKNLQSFFIPIQVYLENVATTSKEFWDIIENTFYIFNHVNYAPINTSTTLTYVSNTAYCDSLQDIQIQFQDLANPLSQANKDAYLIQVASTLTLQDDQDYHLFDAQFSNTLNPTSIAFLVNCKGIIIYPSSQEDITSSKIVQTITTKTHIPPFQDPYLNRSLTGYACYVKNRYTQRFNFKTEYPQTVPAVFPLPTPQQFYKLNFNLDFDYQAKDLFTKDLLYVSTDRQDYIFTVTFNQWQKIARISLLINLQNWKTDYLNGPTSICQEETGSDIQVKSCRLASLPTVSQSQYSLLFVDIYTPQTAANLSQKLIFSTSYDSFQPIESDGYNYDANKLSLAISKQNFTVRLYGLNTLNPSSLSQIEVNYTDYTCYVSNFPSGLTTLDKQKIQHIPQTSTLDNNQNPVNIYAYIHNQSIRSWLPFHRYIDEFVGCNNNDQSPIQFEIQLPKNYQISSGSPSQLNSITIYYGSSIQIPASQKQTDLIINKLICYVNDERAKCVNNQASNSISIFFMQGYDGNSSNNHLFVYVSTGNDMDITSQGVTYTGNSTYYRWNYTVQSQNSPLFSGQTNYFPIRHLPINSISCPYKVILSLQTSLNTYITRATYYNNLIVLTIKLNLNPSLLNAVSGFRIMFKNYDEVQNSLNDDIQFLNIQSGGSYPCYRKGTNNSINCILERDKFSEYTIIHVFNLQQVSGVEYFQFLMSQFNSNSYNNNNNKMSEIYVQAMGGQKSFTAPTGQEFLGELSYYRMTFNNCDCSSNISCKNFKLTVATAVYPQQDIIGGNIQSGCGVSNDQNNQENGYIQYILFSDRPDISQYYLFPSVCYQGKLNQSTVVLEILIRDYNEPYDMCTFSPKQFSQNWNDCQDLSQNFQCNISYFMREEGDDNQYMKKLYIYIEFKVNDASIGYLKLPVGMLQCRQTGKNSNGNYRFQAHWACAHPQSCCDGQYNFRQDLVKYLPCSDNLTNSACSQIQVAGKQFDVLKKYNDFSNPKTIFGYITRDSIFLNGASTLNGSINLKLANLLNQNKIKTQFGYQIAIQIIQQNNIVLQDNFCRISGGVGNWDQVFYKNKIECNQQKISSNTVYLVDKFTDLYDYLRLLIQFSFQQAGQQSLQLNVYVFQHPVVQPITLDPTSKIFQNSEPVCFLQTTIQSYIDIINSSNASIKQNFYINQMKIYTGSVTFDLNIPQQFQNDNFYDSRSYSIQIMFEGFDFDNNLTYNIQGSSICGSTLEYPSQGQQTQTYNLKNIQWTYYNNNLQINDCTKLIQDSYDATNSVTTLNLKIFTTSNVNFTRKRFFNFFVTVYQNDYKNNYPYNNNIDNKYYNYYYYTFQSQAQLNNKNYFGLIATNFNIKTLTTSSNTINELEIYLDDLKYYIGKSNNIILSLEPTNRSNSDPTILPQIDSQLYNSKDRINCRCYYFNSTGEYEYQQYMCIRIIETQQYYLSMQIYIYDQNYEQNISKMHCFIPEYQNGNTSDTFILKIIEPGLYDFSYNVNTCKSYQAIAYSFYNLVYQNFANQQSVSFKQVPYFFSNFQNSTNYPVGPYYMEIGTINVISINNPYIYMSNSLIGPVLDATLCDNSTMWSSSCFAQSMESSYPENDTTGNSPSSLKTHICRVSGSQTIIVEDENYDQLYRTFQGYQFPNNRKFYIYFSVLVAKKQSSITFKMRYLTKYNIQGKNDYSFESARGSYQVNYTSCQPDCINQNNHRTFPFNVKRFISNQFVHRFYLSQFYDTMIQNFLDTTQKWQLQNTDSIQYDYVPIVRIYGLNGCSRNYKERYFQPQTGQGQTNILWQGDYFELGNAKYQYQEYYVRYTDSLNFGLPKTSATLSQPSSSMIILGQITAGNTQNTTTYFDQKKYYFDTSTQQQSQELKLDKLYYTNTIAGYTTSVFFKFLTTFQQSYTPLPFPASYFEFIYPQLAVSNFVTDQYGIVNCQVFVNDDLVKISSKRNQQPRCRVFKADYQNQTVAVFRIEDLNIDYTMNSISFAYDIKLPNPLNSYFSIDVTFDLYLAQTPTNLPSPFTVTPFSYQKYHLKIQEMILIDTVNSVSLPSPLTLSPSSTSNLTLGQVGVSNNWTLSWAQPTTVYDQNTSPGQKIEIRFQNGGIVQSQDNQVNNLQVYFNDVLQTPMWFSKLDQVLFFSAPNLASGSQLQISIKASNTWANQKYFYQPPSSSPVISLISYTGIPVQMDGNMPRPSQIYALNENQFSNYQYRNLEFSVNLFKDDQFQDSQIVNKQRVTLIIQLQNNLSSADVQIRKVWQIQIQFTAGIDSIERCFFKTASKTVADIYQICQVTSQLQGSQLVYQINYSGNIFSNSQQNLHNLYIQAIINSATISYTINQITQTPYLTKQSELNYPIEGQLAGQSYIFSAYQPTSQLIQLDFIQAKHFPLYYEIYQVRQFANRQKFISKLRFRFKLQFSLQQTSGDQIKIKIPSTIIPSNSYKLVNSNELYCVFYEELAPLTTYDIHKLSICSYSNQSLTFQIPDTQLLPSTYYILEVKERYLPQYFYMPSQFTFNEFIIEQQYQNQLYYDTSYQSCPQTFSTFNIYHFTVTQNDYDMLRLNFVPQTTLSKTNLSSSPQESFLLVELESQYFQVDVGLLNPSGTYQTDSLPPFYNGRSLSCILQVTINSSTQSYDCNITVMFGLKIPQSIEQSRIQFVLSDFSNFNQFTQGTTYDLYIPLIQMPSVPKTSIQTRLSFMKVQNDQYITQETSYWINYASVQTDTSIQTPFKLFLSSNLIQQTSSTLTFNFDTNKIISTNNNSILLKWNNMFSGISGDDIKMKGISTNCQYLMFKNLNMMFVTSFQYSLQGSAQCDISSFQTQNFVQPYGFQFVYVNNIAFSQTAYRVSSVNLTTNLTQLNDQNGILTWSSGYLSQYSVSKFILTLQTPNQVPQGSILIINLQTDLISFEERCVILSGLTPIQTANGIFTTTQFNQGSLQCQKISKNQYAVSGFQAISTSQKVQIELYLQVLSSSFVQQNIFATLYATQQGKLYPITNYTIQMQYPQTNRGLGMQYLSILKKIEIFSYSNDWVRMSYLLNTRNMNLIRNKGCQVTFTLPPSNKFTLVSDANSLLYSKYIHASNTNYQDSNRNFMEALNQFQSTGPFISTINYTPYLYPINQPFYDIASNTDTIMMIDSNTASPLLNQFPYQIERKAIYIPQPDYYVFHLTTFDAQSLYEEKYYEYFAIPREDIDDSFKIKTLTAEAGARTTLILQFTLNVATVQNDEIWIIFLTYDGLYGVFPIDLGLKYDQYNQIQCSYTIQSTYQDPQSPQNCFIQLGVYDKVKPIPVIVRIPILNQMPANQQIIVIIPYIINPSTPGQTAGLKVQLRNKCSDHGSKLCIKYHAENSYFVLPPSTVSKGTCMFQASPQTVSQVPDNNSNPTTPLHTITTLNPSGPTSLPAGTYVQIIYPENHVQDNPVCIFLKGICIYYTNYNMVLLKIQDNTFTIQSPFNILGIQNGIYRSTTATQSLMNVVIYLNNMIYSTYVCNMVQNEYSYYNPIIPSSFPSICGTFTNTQTINSSYFLREGYKNTAKLQVYGMYYNKHVNIYRIQKPSTVQSFVSNYCFASLQLAYKSSPKINNIPYDCDVYSEFIIIRKLDSIQYDEAIYNFKGSYLTVYFKFIIDKDIPKYDINTSITIYSCVGNCFDLGNQLNLLDFMHVAICTINWIISYLPQPNLATAGFYTQPYYLRQAQINQLVEFQMLIRPRTSPLNYVIDTFVFKIPSDFLIPQQQSFDSCLIQGTIDLSIQSCNLQRRNGNNRLTLIPADTYDNSAKIITLSNKNTSLLFTSPPFPGQYSLMGIEMYSKGQLVETQFVNITEVIGTNFYQYQDLFYFNIINPINQLQNEIFHFIFSLNDQVLPIGYLRLNSTSTLNIYSNIMIFFEFIGGGWNIHQGYMFDLGTGLPDGARLGCSSKELKVLSGNQLTCILNHGTSPEKMPNIVISGYESFTYLKTPINIYITNLQSLAQGQLMTIKVGVKTIYPSNGCSGYLYTLNAFIPPPTVGPAAKVSETMIITVNSQQTVVYSTTSYTFTISISSSYPGSPKINFNDLIGLKFPKNFIGKYQPILNNDINTFIFPESDSIYIRIANSNTGSSISITIQDVNNPDFQMLTPGAYSISGVILDQNHQIKYRMIGNLPSSFIILPFSQIPYVQVAAVNSISGGDINVAYQFTFITGHYIPPNGSISFFFPEGAYSSVKSMWNGCDLSGGVFNDDQNQSYCTVQIGNRLDVILVNTLLSQIQKYTVVIYGITNPNIQNIQNYLFLMQTYYTNQPSLQQVIGRVTFKMPFLLYLQPFTCNMSVNPQYRQVSVESIYTFSFICNGVVRFKSNLQITLPYQYGTQSNIGQKYCTSTDKMTLYKSSCLIQNINGQVILDIQLKQILLKTQFSVMVKLQNPSTISNLYMFQAAFYKDQLEYAYSLNSSTLKNNYADIISDQTLKYADPSQANTEITLQNYPLSSGEPATYIFMIPQIQFSKTVEQTDIFFPSTFSSQIGINLECSLLQSNSLRQTFDMQILLQMRTNLTSTQSTIPNYYKIECVSSIDYILSIKGIDKFLQNKSIKYNYILIRNIYNPGDNSQNNFKIIHSSYGDMIWAFSGNLTYNINIPPNILDVVSIQALNKAVGDLSIYQFQLSLRKNSRLLNSLEDNEEKNLQILEQSQRVLKDNPSVFGIQIKIPDSYLINQQPSKITCYQTNQITQVSPCHIYKEYLLITDVKLNINALANSFQIQYLTNPQTTNPCIQPSSQLTNNYFQFKIIDLTQNVVINNSKQEDKSLCLQFAKNKFNINLSGPTNLVKGITYNFNVTIEMPANSISLEPYTDDNNIIFNPTLLLFENFDKQTTKQLQVKVLYKAQSGTHTIQFRKIEYTRINLLQISKNTQEIYVSPPKFEIYVQDLNLRKQRAPQIIINDFIEYGVTYSQFLVSAKVTQQTSEQFVFGIQYEKSLKKIININPETVIIDSSVQSFNFTITYLAETIVQPIILNFTLSSFQQQFIYTINPSYKYLVFTISNIHKPLNILRLLFQTNEPSASLFLQDVGKTLFNPQASDPSLLSNNQKVLPPEVLSVIQLEISNYDTTVSVITSFSSYIYYVLTLQNSQIPDPSVIRKGIYLDNLQLGYSVVMTNRYAGNNIDYKANITLSELSPDFSYSLFLVCENAFGLSQSVFQYNFQTMRASFGVVFRFTLSQAIKQANLINQLSQSLRISQNQIQILTNQDDINSQISRNGFITYEIVIAPYTQTRQKISDYINSYLAQSELFNIMMANYLPSYVSSLEYSVSTQAYYVQGPQFLEDPEIIQLGFYNAAISVKMLDNSIIYAQVVERSLYLYNSQIHNFSNSTALKINSTKNYINQPLISQQIILGVDQRNNNINQNWFIKVQTDSKTKAAIIQLDDLKDGAEYDIYITATNIMAYNDSSLFTKLPDTEIKKISFTTLYNYNTDDCQMLRDVYRMNQSLGLALFRQVQRNPKNNLCVKIFYQETNNTKLVIN
ncbi:hypothetical protein ABPG73_002585 [Tetrahymena malaccensis]